MRFVVGSDHRGFALKKRLISWLERHGHAVRDCGPASAERCDYPDYAFRVSDEVASGRAERGILVCSTGIGMSIAANRRRGVRAALCASVAAARMSRRHNDANVLCLGADVITGRQAERMLGVWVSTDFEAGRHARRVKKLDAVPAKPA